MEIKLPYSKSGMYVNIPDKNMIKVLQSKAHDFKTTLSESEIVKKALENPIESETLEELVKDKKDVVIITSDHTRPVPSRITLPIILNKIRNSNPDIDIKIIISTGCHRPSTREELVYKMGEEIVDKENIIMHFANDEESMVKVGKLPSGGDLIVNKAIMETDLLIAEGFIEPHFFAGFSGGRKSVLPGVASVKTIMYNHCSEFIDSPYARTGNLKNNPIHEDMLQAAKSVNLAFILNVAIDKDKKVIGAFAGNLEKAHEAGCEFVTKLSKVDSVDADIVVSTNGGYPLDQNIYQTVKGMTAAEATCKENGVIIMVSACNDGHGGQSFYDSVASASSPTEILEKVRKIPKSETIPDQWEFQILARILEKFTVIMVTDLCDPQMIKNMHMKHASSFEEALQMAFDIKGKDAKVAVIPDGVSVIVK
ncbi:nickel-dependent lactate racemase [Paraclostridium sordellii]|uniref:nickel-dependent lactate racemase n=1 Tax=Paraclostridium sordellii TaxID=1505 RepID=UPI0005E55E4F|nr:nickel-dependent lactate racemase [Paeniclostridium sordellii]MBX9181413.1 nickel-dependent lactate racemase [Paeniclostridium sordellii]MCQ4698690.1 nickel-dependent lactate racemase [Paeniclostridium sordellii]MDU2148909.1 nickel-dependent lactate racemase [Paeniclostridium sordellii]MDU6482082.1 nickel-dependent lactate racemase [Paeniclostridium sordellii]MRZ80629.1 nickel-dependent lactate racemase [Paeniclostridium sordellii]